MHICFHVSTTQVMTTSQGLEDLESDSIMKMISRSSKRFLKSQKSTMIPWSVSRLEKRMRRMSVRRNVKKSVHKNVNRNAHKNVKKSAQKNAIQNAK